MILSGKTQKEYSKIENKKYTYKLKNKQDQNILTSNKEVQRTMKIKDMIQRLAEL